MLKWPWNCKSHDAKRHYKNSNWNAIDSIKFPLALEVHSIFLFSPFLTLFLPRSILYFRIKCRTRSKRYFEWSKTKKPAFIADFYLMLSFIVPNHAQPYWELWIKCKRKHQFNCFCTTFPTLIPDMEYIEYTVICTKPFVLFIFDQVFSICANNKRLNGTFDSSVKLFILI